MAQLTLQQFGQTIKDKYPNVSAYQSLDNETLANKVIEKYPQYKSQVSIGSPFEQKSDAGIQKYKQIPVIGGLMSGLAGIGKTITNALSLPQVGQDISQGLYLAFGGQKNIDKITKQYLDNASTLTQLAQKQTDPALKAKYAKMAVDDITEAKNAGGSIIGDTRTPEQIVGDFVGLTTDVLSAGTLPEAGAATEGYQTTAKIAPTILESASKGAEIGGKAGLAFGAGQGLASGLQSKGNVGQVAQSTIKGTAIGGAAGLVGGAALGAGGAALADKTPAAQKAEELSNIQDTISPKPTVKEARLAESQGRLVKGKPATFWKSQTADEILPADKTIKASETIQRNISNASSMNETDLYTAIDKKTGEIAKQLTPEMQKVPITDEVNTKLNDEWSSVKEKQISGADKTEEANVAKRQESFETNVLKKLEAKKNPTMNDLWEARQEYDNSVPKRVKEANVNSDSKLLAQKDEWLQNRRVLNNAINDSSTGLGKTSKQAFSDMSDMYNAKQGILSKAKVQSTALQPSTVKKIGKAAVKGLIGGTIIEKAAKGLGASWLP